MGVRPLAWHQRRWDDGRTLLRADLGDAVVEAFGFPHYQTHRADLLGALVGALPPERLHVGHLLRGLVDHGDRVEATFANGTTIEVDLLVGADGIHSVVRATLFGPQDPRLHRLRRLPRAGAGRAPGPPRPRGDRPDLDGARGATSCTTTSRASGSSTSSRSSSRTAGRASRGPTAGDPADAIAAFEGWHPQLHEILGAVDDTFIWALFDRPPLAHWSQGRVTLLGDACHAMLPFMAQGAAQALEDGATLTACLTDGAPTSPRPCGSTSRCACRARRASRRLSTENKTRFHLPDGPAQRERDAAMAGGGTDFALKAVEWIYAHDAAAVDASAPTA